MKKLTLALLATLLPATAHAYDPKIEDALANCNTQKYKSQADLTTCKGNASDMMRKQMEELVASTRKQAVTRDHEMHNSGSPAYNEDLLLKSQRAYETYMQVNCERDAANHDGSTNSVVDCHMRMMGQRIMELTPDEPLPGKTPEKTPETPTEPAKDKE